MGDNAALGFHQQLHAVIEPVGTGHIHQLPQPFDGNARRVQSVLGPLGVGPRQAARSQQDAAEIPGDHTEHIGDIFPLVDVEHGLTGGALGLAVVGVPLHAPLF